MFTTVQPVGHLEVPRVMVSFVPSAAGHLNVPVADTPLTQFDIRVDHVVIPLSSMYFRLLHPENIWARAFVPVAVAMAILPVLSSPVHL